MVGWEKLVSMASPLMGVTWDLVYLLWMQHNIANPSPDTGRQTDTFSSLYYVQYRNPGMVGIWTEEENVISLSLRWSSWIFMSINRQIYYPPLSDAIFGLLFLGDLPFDWTIYLNFLPSIPKDNQFFFQNNLSFFSNFFLRQNGKSRMFCRFFLFGFNFFFCFYFQIVSTISFRNETIQTRNTCDWHVWFTGGGRYLYSIFFLYNLHYICRLRHSTVCSFLQTSFVFVIVVFCCL